MKRILIVDDYRLSRMALRAELEQIIPGATIIEAVDTASALESVKLTIPDLLITDYDMPPGPDGLALAETLHSLPTSGRTCGIPIVLVSGSDPDAPVGKPSPGVTDTTMRAKARRHGIALCPKPVAVPRGSAPFSERLVAAIHEAQAIVAPLRRSA